MNNCSTWFTPLSVTLMLEFQNIKIGASTSCLVSTILVFCNILTNRLNCDHFPGRPLRKILIHSAIREWEEFTCLRFKERTNQKDYIEFLVGKGG